MTRSALAVPRPAAPPAGAHPAPRRTRVSRERQAFVLLHVLFTVVPIAFGVDKLLGLLADWDSYLAPWIDELVPGDAHAAMLMVGAIEVVAGLLVAVLPTLGGYVVAAWLGGIVVNLLTLGGHTDLALRDAGLLVAAVALARLASSPAGEPADADLDADLSTGTRIDVEVAR